MDTVLTKYDISECGYARWGEDDPFFYDAASLFGDLDDWVSGKNIGSTQACSFDYHDPDDPNRDQDPPVYCASISQTNGRYLLVTWNEVHNAGNDIPYINRNGEVGGTSFDSTTFDDAHIPGFPAYFWVSPETNEFALVRTPGPGNGHPDLKRFIRGFLKYFALPLDDEEVGRQNDELQDGSTITRTDRGNLRYKSPSGEFSALKPIWESRPGRNIGDIRNLVDRWEELQKVTLKTRISQLESVGGTGNNGAIWDAIRAVFRLGEKRQDQYFQMRIRQELNVKEMSITGEEVAYLVLDWFDISTNNDDWDNVIFDFVGTDSKSVKLADALEQREVNLNSLTEITGAGEGEIDSESLLEELEGEVNGDEYFTGEVSTPTKETIRQLFRENGMLE